MKSYRVYLEEWRKVFFDGPKPPGIKKLRDCIDSGKIPGEEVGEGTGIYIVHCDSEYNPKWPENSKAQAPQVRKRTGNALADSILSRYTDNAPS